MATSGTIGAERDNAKLSDPSFSWQGARNLWTRNGVTLELALGRLHLHCIDSMLIC